MSELFDRVTHVYRCLVSGSRPSLGPAHVAAVICSTMGGPDLAPVGEEGAHVSSPERCHENGVDVTCASVSLVELMVCQLSRSDTETEPTRFCVDTLTQMLQHMDLMTRLVYYFHSEDQIVSHLAARSASACVVHQLLTCGTVSQAWQQKCVRTFHSSPLGAEVDACLKSVTDVFKRLCEAAHQAILGKLVAVFDSSLSDFCSKFLPEDHQSLKESTSVRHWATTFCILLDLLEALSASSLICPAGLKSQRLVHIHSLALLTVVSCTSAHQYYVKKRTVLLLKRVILQRPGEDWAPAGFLSSGQRYEHFNSDMNTLAQAVLRAVAADWLQSVQVKSASYFGGRRHAGSGGGDKADCVMLRGISLLILKSMELHLQTTGRTGVDSAAEISQYLQSLRVFVSCVSVQLREATHPCSWISLLFGEQDDDMMEAAKASLSIFIRHRLCSGLEDLSELQAACTLGFNPHCHFLSLLQSVSFDHSILLDFLISSETCFLEYSVRYLKYLRSDWQGFSTVCERVTEPLPEPLIGCHGDEEGATMDKAEPEHSSCGQPPSVLPLVERLVTGLRLVEYDSSDESDAENSEISEDGPGALDMKPESPGKPVLTKCDSAQLQNVPTATSQRGAEGVMLVSSQRSWQDMAPLMGAGTSDTLARAVGCLGELREVVTRLQTKKLFPYNPSSLLKLLAQVEDCSQQPPLSRSSK